MCRGLTRRVSCRIVAALGWLALVGLSAWGSGAISWNTELVIPLSSPTLDFAGSWTVLSGSYILGEGYGIGGTITLPLPDTAGGALSVNAQIERDLVINWPVGTWGVASNATFALDTPALSSFSATANVTAFGTSTTIDFNLYPFGGAYATGLTLMLSGATQSGWGASIASSFGDPGGTPCNFDYTGTTIGFEAFPWCCLTTDITVTFSCAGYESTSIDLQMELLDGVLVLDGALQFALDEKSPFLIPYFTFGEQCIWVSIATEPHFLGLGATTLIDQLIVQGLGIESCEIGPVTFSTIWAFDSLYRSKGATDIDLHANGYFVGLAPGTNPGAWTKTDYTTVFTLQSDAATFLGGYSSSELILDFYFGTQDTTLFDFALFTAEWQHDISEAFAYSLAVQLDPTGEDYLIKLGFVASTLLP